MILIISAGESVLSVLTCVHLRIKIRSEQKKES